MHKVHAYCVSRATDVKPQGRLFAINNNALPDHILMRVGIRASSALQENTMQPWVARQSLRACPAMLADIVSQAPPRHKELLGGSALRARTPLRARARHLRACPAMLADTAPQAPPRHKELLGGSALRARTPFRARALQLPAHRALQERLMQPWAAL